MIVRYSRWKSLLALGLSLFFGLPLSYVTVVLFISLWGEDVATVTLGGIIFLLIFGIPTLSSHLVFIVSIQRLFFGLKAFELTEKHFVLYRGIFRRKAVSIPINEIEFIGIEEQTLGAGLSRLFGNVSEKTVESIGKTIAFATESKTSARASLSDTYTHLLILFHDSERAVFYAKQYGIKIKNLLKYTAATSILDVEPGPIEHFSEEKLQDLLEERKLNK
ncbi:hypothetical protein ACTGUZ_01495 [Streptococcus suis]|nr:hypothetical protein [Streptococcus suis]MBO4131122.1 hypothetical protein [Streptococcus suis]MBO4132600.1 hypothetical protein [Streptococcus suis]NQK11965.1 hypothetical protein [Streptococcus suis]HEM3555093.1 hypothetical protein [Streptococcus suis]HEM3557403.1 hypothetical protein [Streptococcus suis]